jgi:hypothetical protein
MTQEPTSEAVETLTHQIPRKSDPKLILAGSVLVSGREQLLL